MSLWPSPTGHWWLRGRVVVVVAACWAVATMSMVMVFAVSPLVAPPTWSAIMFIQTLTVGASACASFVLAWQLAWRRLAAGAHLMARGSVALGAAMLAFNYAVLALREAGVLAPPTGLEQMADLVTGLTMDLWISSAVLLLGAVSQGVFSRLRSDSRAA